MSRWQFTVLFLVGVGGAVALLVASLFGRDIPPTALTGVGAILTYVLTQRDRLTHNGGNDRARDQERTPDA
jgi:hypothetical protein